MDLSFGHLRATLLAAVVLAAPFSAAGEPSAMGPSAIVDVLHAELLEVMKRADELRYAGRFERLGPVLDEQFDMPFMARMSVGRYWKNMDEANRERLQETFREFTVANFASRFDGYSGQRFETLREEPSSHGTVLVHTRLVDPAGEETQLNYRLHSVNGGWRIFDIFLNGTVSEIALRRSEYSDLIKRDGIDALVVALRGKIEDLSETEAPAAP